MVNHDCAGVDARHVPGTRHMADADRIKQGLFLNKHMGDFGNHVLHFGQRSLPFSMKEYFKRQYFFNTCSPTCSVANNIKPTFSHTNLLLTAARGVLDFFLCGPAACPSRHPPAVPTHNPSRHPSIKAFRTLRIRAFRKPLGHSGLFVLGRFGQLVKWKVMEGY